MYLSRIWYGSTTSWSFPSIHIEYRTLGKILCNRSFGTCHKCIQGQQHLTHLRTWISFLITNFPHKRLLGHLTSKPKFMSSEHVYTAEKRHLPPFIYVSDPDEKIPIIRYLRQSLYFAVHHCPMLEITYPSTCFYALYLIQTGKY